MRSPIAKPAPGLTRCDCSSDVEARAERSDRIGERGVDAAQLGGIVEPRQRMADEREVRHEALAVVEQRCNALDRQPHAARLDATARERGAERGERREGLAPREALVDGVA